MEDTLSERACVYTVLFGNYEELLEQPVATESGLDFICFTDDPELESASWQVRLVQRAIPADPARSSRYPKICAHRFLQSYDVSIYIDNSVLLAQVPEKIIEALLPSDAEFAAIAHSFRETVIDEFRAVVEAKYDAEWICEEQLEHYQRSSPDVLMMQPLIGGVLLRRHMQPDVIRAMDLWWFNVLRYSRRDQLSFRVALAQASLAPTVRSLDIRDNEYWQWPASTGRVRRRGGTLPTPSQAQMSTTPVADRTEPMSRPETADDPIEIERLLQLQNARDDQIARLSSVNTSLRQQLEAIRASRSWRITRGLRALGSFVRRF